MLRILLVITSLLAGGWCRPDGPPLPFACQNQLVPQHQDTSPQNDTAPYSIEVEGSYVAGATLTVTISVSDDGRGFDTFRGFWVQARASENGEAIGSFIAIADNKTKTFGCPSEATDNSASHSNADQVQSVTVNWRATPEQLNSISEFKFYYTVVYNFSTYWVMLSSESVTTGNTTNPTSIANPCLRESYSLILIKSHGSAMCFAWCLLAPVGILIAMFYKVVWPNGQWFYSHLGIMLGTLVFTIAGLVLIVFHASGTWLTTTPLNSSHQIFGIIAAAAVGINPFMAILRCDPSSQWRWIYNWVHGLTGLILGQIAAFCAMILGLNIYRDCADNVDFVHYAVYTVSGTIGVFIAIMAFYNIYAVNYSVRNPDPSDYMSDSDSPESFPNLNKEQKEGEEKEEEEDELEEPSEDYPLRASFGVGIIVLLFALTAASIALIALT